MIEDDDPFARVTGRRADVITGGRYRLPDLQGQHRKGGWQRVSNLVSAYSDQFALRLWEIEHVLRGVRGGYELYRELLDTDLDAMDRDTRKEYIEGFTERCKKVSGGAEGSEHGNQRHAMVEDWHSGLPLGIQNAGARRHLSLYASALVRNDLVALDGMQERRVLIERLGAVGTLDNVLRQGGEHERPAGELYIGDLKTQKRFWTWLEIAAQQACYANADAMWCPLAGAWQPMPKVSTEIAKILWMPRVNPCVMRCNASPCEHPAGPPIVEVWNVDIVKGWGVAQRAYEVVQDRAAAKAKRNPWGWLAETRAVSEHERYAAMFAAVESVAEGKALVEEVKKRKLWDVILADCAKEAVQRLTSTKI